MSLDKTEGMANITFLNNWKIPSIEILKQGTWVIEMTQQISEIC